MKVALGILFALVLTVLTIFTYLGGFKTVTVEERQVGPYFLIYETNKGSYRQTGSSVEKLMEHAKKQGVTPQAGFGHYLDDPRAVPESELRSEAGIVVSQTDYSKLSMLDQFKSREVAPIEAAVAEFPLKNSLSILIGIFKVYPVILNYLKEKGYTPGPSFEIYEIENKKTLYLFPISRT
jgi:hypothetical protein